MRLGSAFGFVGGCSHGSSYGRVVGAYRSGANWNHVLPGTCVLHGVQYVCDWVKDRRGWFPVRVDWDNPSEVDVFNIKQNLKAGQCIAMRCTTTPVTAQGLCPRHDIEWSQAGSPELAAAPKPAPGAALAKATQPDELSRYEAKREEARQALQLCRSLKPTDQASLDRAVAIAAMAKQERNAAQKERDNLLEPANETVKRIKQALDPVIAYYDACESALKDNVKEFLLTQQTQQDLALAAVASQGAQASPNLLVVAHGNENAQLPSAMGAINFWKIVRIDMSRLPPEYKLVIADEPRLESMLKEQGGDFDVPGVTIERDMTMVNRG